MIDLEESLAEGVSLLLTSGHSMVDIRGYSLRQINGFVGLAARYKKLQLRDSMWAVRAGFGAEQKDWKQIMNSLEDHG